MAPEVVFTVRGMLRLLQLCQVGRKMSDFLNCTDKDTWMSLYKTADARIESLGFFESQKIRRVLPSFADAQQRAAMLMDDRAAAVFYKGLLTKHILYFAMFDPTAFGLPSDGVVFSMIWFSGQIHTFLGRTNGSVSNIVKMIEMDLKRVRAKGDFPPVPVDFFVAAIRLVAQVTESSSEKRFYQKGRPRLPELESYLRQKQFY
jgi:hypothetical protein